MKEKIIKIFLDSYSKQGWNALRLLPILGFDTENKIVNFILSLDLELPIVLRETDWLPPSISHGWGNGYVKLPKNNKYYGVDYDDIDVSAPGGLTYSQMENDEWVVGFDTAHSFNGPHHDYNYVKFNTVLLFYKLYTS